MTRWLKERVFHAKKTGEVKIDKIQKIKSKIAQKLWQIVLTERKKLLIAGFMVYLHKKHTHTHLFGGSLEFVSP